MFTPLSKKTLEKWNKELLELHKRVLKTEVASMEIKYSVKAKILKLYGLLINEDNIQEYFHTPIFLLIKGMVQGNLEDYRTLILNSKPKKKRKK